MAYKITYCTLLPMQFYRLFVVQLEAAEAAVKEAEQIRQGSSIDVSSSKFSFFMRQWREIIGLVTRQSFPRMRHATTQQVS